MELILSNYNLIEYLQIYLEFSNGDKTVFLLIHLFKSGFQNGVVIFQISFSEILNQCFPTVESHGKNAEVRITTDRWLSFSIREC